MTYHEALQRELDNRVPQRPLSGLTPIQLLAISRRPLPVFNRHTGERV